MSRTTEQEQGQVVSKLSRRPTSYRLTKARNNSGPRLGWEAEEEAVHDQCRSGLVGFFPGRAELADQSANLKRQEERGYRRREMHEYADQLCVLNNGLLLMNRSVFDHRISSNTVLGLTERVDMIILTQTIRSKELKASRLHNA
jgi:hypothetical protein